MVACFPYEAIQNQPAIVLLGTAAPPAQITSMKTDLSVQGVRHEAQSSHRKNTLVLSAFFSIRSSALLRSKIPRRQSKADMRGKALSLFVVVRIADT